MHNYRSNQSAFMARFGTDLRHQYGIFGGKSQTAFSRIATRPWSEEGRLFSHAIFQTNPSLKDLARQELISFTKHQRPISGKDLEVLYAANQLGLNALESFANSFSTLESEAVKTDAR